MESKKIVCQDCGKEFDFSVRDQEFYQENGWTEPKRCKDCREKRKQEREARNNASANNNIDIETA